VNELKENKDISVFDKAALWLRFVDPKDFPALVSKWIEQAQL
jgi:hypothetical protein